MHSEPAINQGIMQVIRRKLDAVERDHGVRVLFAVESGSVRPACALRWLVERGTLPPMNLGALDGITLPMAVRRVVDRLLEQKAQTSELGKGRRVRVLDRWIERELGHGEKRCGVLAAETSMLADAEAYFRQVLDGVSDR
jgi:predicted nucleotidyltransferase